MPGWVAAGNPYTAEAAVAAFDAGASALDAALAAALAAFVTEPLLASAGGGGLLVHAPVDGPVRCLDFFPRAPGVGASRRGGSDFEAIDVDFGPVTQRFFVGRASACAPCVLPAFAMANRERGRLPLSTLIAPATRFAREGVPLGTSGAEVFALLRPIVEKDPQALRNLFGDDFDAATGVHADQRIYNPDFADLLERWAASGELDAAWFSALLACAGPDAGGSLTPADLEAARPDWRDTHASPLGDGVLATPPLAGGRAVATMCAQMAGLPPGEVYDEGELASALAHAGVHADRERLGARPRGSTTHISTADDEGNCVALTLSNGEGCGYMVPGTGVLLNNFMGEEDLNPHGHFAHTPGDRLPTMMSPCVFRSPETTVALGSGGANRIRSAVTRVIDAIVHRGASLSEAILAPRVHAEGERVWYEASGWAQPRRVAARLAEQFPTRDAFDARAFFFGGVHAVRTHVEGAEAFGDPRRAGTAARSEN